MVSLRQHQQQLEETQSSLDIELAADGIPHSPVATTHRRRRRQDGQLPEAISHVAPLRTIVEWRHQPLQLWTICDIRLRKPTLPGDGIRNMRNVQKVKCWLPLAIFPRGHSSSSLARNGT
jgi:hypothetical protein